MRGFLLDLNRCTGCHACQLACSIENDLGPDGDWRQVHTFNMRRRTGASRFHLSLACLHCADPACMRGCPASAYRRDPATGAVLVDSALCIGCKYCSWACPFDAPRYSQAEGTISKCTLCNDRLLEAKDPACASLCPTGALQFREIRAEDASIGVPGFPATAIGPSIEIVPLRSTGQGPELATSPESLTAAAALENPDTHSEPKITIESEWSLIFFSVSAALLVAIACAGIFGALRINADDFLIASLGSIAVSFLHLGKAQRAWRALGNLRHSWLSREIACFLAFTILTGLLFFFPAYAPLLEGPALIAGFGALFCIDRVYEFVSGNRWSRLHSARTLLTGLFLLGILTANVPIAGMAGLIKLILYAYRQPWVQSHSRMMASILRLGLGFVAPLAIWMVYPGWVLPLVLSAEVIDRCEYFLDLDIQSPRRQIAADLRKISG